ncbi:MAG: hypothetical protein K6T73_01190 [Candidatus Bathyarchaeota archaeon]|nr:hypothetical protein [Candidatus Bathyarchaeota archaeon]
MKLIISIIIISSLIFVGIGIAQIQKVILGSVEGPAVTPPPSGDYLIAWYKFNEGSGDTVINHATNGVLGGGLLPDLTVSEPSLFWDVEGFGHGQKVGEAISFASAIFEDRILSETSCVAGFMKIPQGSGVSSVSLIDISGEGYLTFSAYTAAEPWNPYAQISNDEYVSICSFDIIDQWVFVFIDDSNYPKMVKLDGTLISFDDEFIPISFFMNQLEAVFAGGSLDILGGDILIYNNKRLTQSEWSQWYDELRSRYGMAPRNGW